jgi:hypothetical protein
MPKLRTQPKQFRDTPFIPGAGFAII